VVKGNLSNLEVTNMEIALMLLCLALIFDAILIERLTRRVDALQKIVVRYIDLECKKSAKQEEQPGGGA
jgi:hypothetical protein